MHQNDPRNETPNHELTDEQAEAVAGGQTGPDPAWDWTDDIPKDGKGTGGQ